LGTGSIMLWMTMATIEQEKNNIALLSLLQRGKI
jgi:hypothetical protein